MAEASRMVTPDYRSLGRARRVAVCSYSVAGRRITGCATTTPRGHQMSAASTVRRILFVVVLGTLLAATGGASWRDSAHGATLAVTSDGLLDQAAAAPDGHFRVIVQAVDAAAASASVGDAISSAPADTAGVTDAYSVIPAVAATLTGDQVVALAGDARVTTITSDGKVVLTGGASA